MESVTREKLTRDFGNAFLSLQHTRTLCMQLLLSKYNLYPGQPQVLFALKELGAPTQNELAAYLGVGKASAGVSIRRLESGGFVKRTRDKKDTRCIRLALTSKGEEFARWCSIDYDMFFSTMLESLSQDERASAYDFIQAMEVSELLALFCTL